MAVVLGSYGILARAVLFFLCGIFLAVAAYDSNSEEAVSVAGVLRAMQHQAHGGVLLGTVFSLSELTTPMSANGTKRTS